MKIPQKIKIFSHTYRVKLVPSSEIDDNSCGTTDSAVNLIKIRNDLTKTQLEETFFHEIIHAMNSEIKESEVEWLAQGLYSILTINNLLK